MIQFLKFYVKIQEYKKNCHEDKNDFYKEMKLIKL